MLIFKKGVNFRPNWSFETNSGLISELDRLKKFSGRKFLAIFLISVLEWDSRVEIKSSFSKRSKSKVSNAIQAFGKVGPEEIVNEALPA